MESEVTALTTERASILAQELLANVDRVSHGESVTARNFAREVTDRFSAPAASAFEKITESYLALRFGDRKSSPSGDPLRILRQELTQSAP